MCGIAGVMTKSGKLPESAFLDRLATALAHRGPDGEGRYQKGDVAMVQRRLAIIDLENGDQPIYEPHGSALIANGEIYNYIELAATIDSDVQKSKSDCEPPLHYYRQHGMQFTSYLRGMYAIAIHDSRSDQLILARDPFGIKPLYYVETQDWFAFASEPEALIAAGLSERVCDDERAQELLQLQFTTGRETVYQGICRVLPGETLVVSQGRVVERQTRPALPEGGPGSMAPDAALALLDDGLMDCVRLHQRSDVDYGMFLSGGIDSSALLALMARLNERPVRAYVAGFSGNDKIDERPHARAVAKAVGAEITEVSVSVDDFWRELPRIVQVVDDPCADYAVVPTYLLAREAAKDVKVILSGEGGDELFAGYGRYRSAVRPWWLGGRQMRTRGILGRLGVLRTESGSWRDGIVAAIHNAQKESRSRLQVAQAADIGDWLANDLLIKLDRCLMAHGVEGRTPFLDPNLAEIVFTLPDNLKVRGRVGKWILRQWLSKHLPAAESFGRKRGFTVPVAQWISERGKVLGELVAAEPGVARLCHSDAVKNVFISQGKHAGFAAWALLFFALWHQAHCLGKSMDGDVFACLGDSR